MNRILTVTIFIIISMNCYSQGSGDLLKIDGSTITKLKEFRHKKKFLADDRLLYPGAGSEATRILLESKINELADRLISGIAINPRKSFVMDQFRVTLAQCVEFDTENRERICSYMEEIMDILGIESSDGLLNRWMYGLDLHKILLWVNRDA